MNFKLLTLMLLSSVKVFSQNYWQQEVNYNIQVTLNDKTHFLNGFETIIYTNNSTTTLNEIYFHVWANAYDSKKSALGKQLYKNGENSLQFAKKEEKGFMDSLNFAVNGQTIQWELTKENKDIAILHLITPLKPNEKITITTPFRVKIPNGEISRLGHEDQAYQITQWYPKPAVFDKNGWNAMPYLNQGEFYSEYGSFDVSITLPSNYIVGATGDLQTESEIAFLDEQNTLTKNKFATDRYNTRKKSNDKDAFPASSETMKTIRYTQNNVHDFAWFADKRFGVLKGEVTLPHSGKSVTTWAMFTPANAIYWQNSIEYINDGTYYYSLWNGDYPYSQVTAIDGTISAGGGMEYPNVTVIGNTRSKEELEVVIVHEVGHNWFYGILGSNERIHGWMDEGLNTLNEMRYVQTKYPNNQRLSDMILGGRFHFDHLNHHDMGDISYRMIADLGEDQPIETKSQEFTPTNYGVIMYQKTGLVFYYLKDYLGEKEFDKAMSAYFEKWKFKHPDPKDLQNALEEASQKNLDWLFNDLIKTTNHIDYKITKIKKSEDVYTLTIKNKGQVNGPIRVDGIKNGKITESKWLEPTTLKNEKIEFKGDFDVFILDSAKNTPELNRQNNCIKTHGAFKKLEPVKFEFLIGDRETNKTNVFWTPIVAGNAYDKFMIGAAFHNSGIPFNPFQYLIAPMYSFGRQMASGIGEFSYSFLPKKHVKLSKFGLAVKSFKNDATYKRNESYYAVVNPYWYAKLGNRGKDRPFSHTLMVQSIYRYDQLGQAHYEHAGGYINYEMKFNYPDHKIELGIRNDYLANVNNNDQIGRSSFTGTYSYKYLKNKMKRWVELRLFAGGYWLTDLKATTNGHPYSMSLSGSDGSQDWFVEDYFFGRSDVSGIWSQQRMENAGGFKSTSNYGSTLNWMATSNLYFQIPVKPGIFGLYADFGAFSNGLNVNTAINTGAAIRFGKIFGIYFPIWMSKEMDAFYNSKRYEQRIRFTLKLNLINKPINLGSFL